MLTNAIKLLYRALEHRIFHMTNPPILLTPGPTPLHPHVQRALGTEMRGHMDPQVFALNKDIQRGLRTVFGCDDTYFTALIAGTGSLGMEAGFANLVQAGDEVIVCVNGTFGARMAEMAQRYGAKVRLIEAELGQAIQPEQLAQELTPQTRLVALVHGETSTGVLNPLEGLATVLADHPALFMVDAVTTVGMQPFDMQGLGIDYAYTGSQKCLSAPPGVAPIAVSPRALEHFANRANKAPSWYCDLGGLMDYWERQSYHHTVPVNLHYALHAALEVALQEGLSARAHRVRELGQALTKTLASLGFRHYVSDDEQRLPTVLTLRLPEQLDDVTVRRKLTEQNISVTGGLGPTAGQIWRLGLMGENAHAALYRHFIKALADIMYIPQLPNLFEEELHASRKLTTAI